MVTGDVVQLRIPEVRPAPRAPTAPWLLTPYPHNQWVVADGASFRMGGREERRTAIIDFDQRLPDGSRLTDPANAAWLALAKRYAFLLREHEQSHIEAATLHAQQVGYIFLLMSWMRLQEKPIDHFEDLRKADVDRYVLAARYGTASVLDVAARAAKLARAGVDLGDVKKVREILFLKPQLDIKEELAIASGASNGSDRKPIVQNPLLRMLMVLEQLWAFRREIDDDNIRIDPFETSASAEAAKHSSQTNRTPVIPHRQAMTLIDGCIRLLVEVGPVVQELRDGMEGASRGGTNRSSREKAVTDLLTGHVDEIEALRVRLGVRANAPPARIVEDATIILVQACFVLVAALSARRHEEIATLRVNCILGGDGRRFVFSAILKTERENQHTPVPDIVSRAVDRLTALGADARERSGGTRLFTWTDATSFRDSPRVRTAVPTNLGRLADVCGVPPHEGARWQFTPRQFRRFFAILYMWRHENPDLGALRHHLRHWDFAQTRAYCTDKTLGRLFTEEQRSFTRTVVMEAVTGARRVGGAAGGRLMSMVARLKSKYAGVVAMDAARLVSWAERISDRMVIKCNPWSYCTCPETRRGAKDVNCRAGGDPHAVGADFANATPETCIGCRHRMSDPIFAPFLRTELAQGERALIAPKVAGTVFAAATARRLDVIRTHLAAADATGAPA